jgi:hypothetical protein
MSSAPPSRLRIETGFYESHKTEWLKAHRDQFVVVKGQEILGFFPSFYEAYTAGAAKYGTDVDFLVKRVLPEEPMFEVF